MNTIKSCKNRGATNGKRSSSASYGLAVHSRAYVGDFIKSSVRGLLNQEVL
jgi:hypothetical protein